MPLVRITLREGKPDGYRRANADGVHRALVETFGAENKDSSEQRCLVPGDDGDLSTSH